MGFGERPWERAGNGVDTRLIRWLVNNERSHGQNIGVYFSSGTRYLLSYRFGLCVNPPSTRSIFQRFSRQSYEIDTAFKRDALKLEGAGSADVGLQLLKPSHRDTRSALRKHMRMRDGHAKTVIANRDGLVWMLWVQFVYARVSCRRHAPPSPSCIGSQSP